MVRASALYMVIIIALVIGILCSALISVAYFYRQQNQRSFRYDLLSNNVESGSNILLVDTTNEYQEGKFTNLFDGIADSVWLKKMPWGIYDVGVSRAYTQGDTLTSVFSLAYSVDSTKWAGLYIPDEDRPISLSGKTYIKGNVFISQSGIREAYIDGKAYTGDKRLVIGKTFNSQKKLPQLATSRLAWLEQQLTSNLSDRSWVDTDSIFRSFIQNTHLISMGKNVIKLNGVYKGNIIIKADTTIVIDSSARLNNVLIFAPYIKVKKGFQGNCQLFASDSIHVEQGVIFDYPSAIGVMRFATENKAKTAELTLDDGVHVQGTVFTYDKSTVREKQPIIRLGKNVTLSGQVYSPGLLQINDGVKINGSVFTGRFLYKSGFTIFENYIVNTTIDATTLSRYYLAGNLIPVVSQKKKILQWLEKE